MSYGPPYNAPPYGAYQQQPPAYGAAPGYPPQAGYGAAPVAGMYGVPPPSARPHGRRPSSTQPGYPPSAGYAPAGFQAGFGSPAGAGAPYGPQQPGYAGGGRERQRYAAGAPPPVGADPQLWQWFTAVDVDQSGAISAQELRQALLNGDWSNFDLDTVKMLMTLFDVDRSGTITFDEFAGLWKYIRDWQNVFRHFDADRSGSIDGRELKNALEQFGYRLNPHILRLLEIKYDLRPSSRSPSARAHDPAASLPRGESRVDLKPGMTFDRFVRACVVTKHLTEAFQRMDDDRDGWVQMNYEQFMSVVLTAP